jgi:precorrin-2/cobalt-factor-2 C20-methyltransferase
VSKSPRRRWGTLYGVGLGPGDPELVTLKAVRILRSVSTLLVPVRADDDSGYAWAIAQPHLVPARQRVVRLPFGHDCEAELDEQWERNCQEVLACLEAGDDAAFLTEGDPLLYGSFIHVAGRLRASVPGLPIEIVPGVSSLNAAAAAAGQPLASRADRLAVLPALHALDDLPDVFERFDTVVLLKVNRVLDRLTATLNDLGLAECAIIVERCGRPEQRILRGLRELPSEVDYFSLVILRK